jgi:hypothetical protein
VPMHRVRFEKPGGYLDEVFVHPVEQDERREYLRLMDIGEESAQGGRDSGYDPADEMSHRWLQSARH